MVSTRSSTSNKGQAKLEDFNTGSKTSSSTNDKKGAANKPKAQGQKRKQEQQQSEPEPVDSAPPTRPSAANAAAIKGNSTVSPSLSEASKRRKPNAASLAPQQDQDGGDGAGGAKRGEKKPKPKSGGRNVGEQAKKAAERQRAPVERKGKSGRDDGGGGDGEGGGRRGEDEDDLKTEKPIMINRSPVLQLWGACVAEFLHGGNEVGWETCLSMGELHALFRTSSIATA